ncbi:TetR/AcrR family transcriptional regulator [Paenibacillus polymyxa]|uniref:TetR/AcrR family transcriptional regulator n=2 Tax=Paenibacillus TaxID=44249 RepID=UPI00202450A7|nr:TetR/AcrR family transcriptional regulator [Paenibacillus polymyxa]URJ43877.1 TetR/AcrR family transcriptional regulator [Paenibacillus polymyxa]
MQERILEAFVEEVHENGLKFTMDDLAKRLAISKRTLYENFSSKTLILETLIERTNDDMIRKTEQIIENNELSLLDKIKQSIRVMPLYYKFYDLRILDQMKKYYPEQWKRVHADLNDWSPIRTLIQEGIREGIIVNKNEALIMKLIIESVNLTLDQRFFLDNSVTVEEATYSIVDILLFGLVEKNKI